MEKIELIFLKKFYLTLIPNSLVEKFFSNRETGAKKS